LTLCRNEKAIAPVSRALPDSVAMGDQKVSYPEQKRSPPVASTVLADNEIRHRLEPTRHLSGSYTTFPMPALYNEGEDAFSHNRRDLLEACVVQATRPVLSPMKSESLLRNSVFRLGPIEFPALEKNRGAILSRPKGTLPTAARPVRSS
jgi:hypothetical protein